MGPACQGAGQFLHAPFLLTHGVVFLQSLVDTPTGEVNKCDAPCSVRSKTATSRRFRRLGHQSCTEGLMGSAAYCNIHMTHVNNKVCKIDRRTILTSSTIN